MSDVCPTCGDPFESSLGVKVHHAKEHGESLATEKAECEQCGEFFEHYPSQKGGRFCSRECKDAWTKEAYQGESHPNWVNRIEKECVVCGESFEVRPSVADSRKVCSKRCQSEHLTGENNGKWKQNVEKECKECGCIFETHQSLAQRRTFCSVDCHAAWLSENQTGADNPFWKAHPHSSVYTWVRYEIGDRPWNTIRDEAIEDECYHCGDKRDETEKRFDVHHIIPIMVGGTNEDWNLMTLCRPCHARTEAFTRRYTDPVLVD